MTMCKQTWAVVLLAVVGLAGRIEAEEPMSAKNQKANYERPFEPPTRAAFSPLPPGAVEPAGWLRDWCVAARDGYTGHMDDVDPAFRQAWAADHKMTGGRLFWDKGGWPYEGGGYWLDGLVRLGYILHDEALIKQAKRRLDVVVTNANDKGILFMWWLDRNNPDDLASAEGRTNRETEWPMWANGLIGRALAGYYAGSMDERVLRALETAYTGERRWVRMGWAPSNLGPAFETYTLTGNRAIHEALTELFAKGGENKGVWSWDRYGRTPNEQPWAETTDHGVHILESTTWALGYLWTGRKEFLDAALRWHSILERDGMQPYGVPVFDEFSGPPGAFRCTETCDVTGYMWSQILLMTVAGQGLMGDRVERAFFNAAPQVVTRDFKAHVYMQSPNRIAPEGGQRIYQSKHNPLCCTAALNRMLPNYVMHMWMATYDNGLAATHYGPCKVSALAADRVPVEIECQTDYPFNETIDLTVKPAREAKFPLFFRMPGWCAKPVVEVNGTAVNAAPSTNGFVRIERMWKPGDAVRLSFPMSVRFDAGRDVGLQPQQKQEVLADVVRGSIKKAAPYATVSYGPLLFVLPIRETKDANTPDPDAKWKYALDPQGKETATDISVERGPMPARWNWPLESPLKLRVNAVGFAWNTRGHSLPSAMVVPASDAVPERITLIPYGCAKFRVSMFPVTEDFLRRVEPTWADQMAAQTFGAKTILLPQDLLKEKFVTPAGDCMGWGKWETPCVYANSGAEEVKLLNGAITVPGRSVLVHPGAERDVAVGWRSPISGKVTVRGKVTHAHPSGGDGVSWAIVLATNASHRVLAEGVIDRAGSQTMPTAPDAGKLAAVSVQKGDSLYLLIGPRENHQCDSTVADLVISESGGAGRVWDFVKDVVADIQAGNPHADSLGNPEVWSFVAPERKAIAQAEESLTSPRPTLGPRAEAWTIATDDTKLTVGATKEGQLVVYELSNPAAGWNWAAEPSVFALLGKVSVGSSVQDLQWKFKDGTMDTVVPTQEGRRLFGARQETWNRNGRQNMAIRSFGGRLGARSR